MTKSEKLKSNESNQSEAHSTEKPPQVQVDDSQATASYANFCRVSGTPEELIIDFGLNSQPAGTPSDPIRITQRIILNHYTAKRLLAALQMSVHRHESVFGVLETDVQKRVSPAIRQSPQSQTATPSTAATSG